GVDEGVEHVAGDVHRQDVVEGADARLADVPGSDGADRATGADRAAINVTGGQHADVALRVDVGVDVFEDGDGTGAEQVHHGLAGLVAQTEVGADDEVLDVVGEDLAGEEGAEDHRADVASGAEEAGRCGDAAENGVDDET